MTTSNTSDCGDRSPVVDKAVLDAAYQRVNDDMARFLWKNNATGETVYSPHPLAALIAEIVAEHTAPLTATIATQPVLVADVVLFAIDDAGLLRVLLIERGTDPDDPNDPVAGLWALPGGCVDTAENETFEQAARRELAEETGLAAPAYLMPVGHFDAPDRDPRGRVISVAYTGFLPRLVEPTAGDDAKSARWVSVDEFDMSALAFDHEDILRAALVAYPNLPYDPWER